MVVEYSRADAQDVRYCLATGTVAEGAEWNERCAEWRYRVEGVDLEGDSMTAITVVVRENYVAVVTILD